MDELTDYSSQVIEFKPSDQTNKQEKLIESSTGTDPIPASKDISIETNRTLHVETQTQAFSMGTARVDEKKLAHWLRKICPAVEVELLKGPTPLLDNPYGSSASHGTFVDDTKIQTYQKISIEAPENSQGLATWLSVYTNNAPLLVVSAIAPHEDWCEHVNQSLKLFTPRRVQTGNFVIFTEEVKSIPIPACLKSLCTNSFNKSVFSGSTMDGDIYVWQYEHIGSNNEVKELFNITSSHGYAVAMEWLAENSLLTCHADGWVVQWTINTKQMLKYAEYFIKPTPNASNEITAMICVNPNNFVVGTKDGGVYNCWISSSIGAVKKEIEITPLKKHLFMVSTLLKTKMSGCSILISCDLSGEVYYHADDDSSNVIVQIPLPFKNAVACSREAQVIYCPGNDGSLECYRIRDGVHSVIKGALRGKGNFIKCSDNGFWIITGLYGNEFQIFYLEH